MVCSLVSIYFHHISYSKIKTKYNIIKYKNKLYKTFNYWSRDMLNFKFLEKALGIVSLLCFVYDFSRKNLFMLYSINQTNSVVLFHLLLDLLGNMCIATVCFPGCYFINFVIKLIFLIKLISYMNKVRIKI